MIRRVIDFYRQAWHDSVASATGRRLWLILILKISILLILFKILFFPNRLNSEYHSDAERSQAVREALTQ